MAPEADAPGATSGMQNTVSLSPMQDKAALDRLRNAVNRPAREAGDAAGLDPGDASFHTASNSLLAGKLAGKQAQQPADVKAGEIRHLLPELAPDADRSVFALVVEVADDKALLMSFGPLSQPATRDELSTGLDQQGLEVLSLWNAAWVPAETVAKSWKVEVEASGLLTDVQAMRSSTLAGHGVPEHLVQRVGASIEHPLDPRWEYLEQEGEVFLKMLG